MTLCGTCGNEVNGKDLHGRCMGYGNAVYCAECLSKILAMQSIELVAGK